MMPRIHRWIGNPEEKEREKILAQVRKHVDALKSQAGHLTGTKLYKDICKLADSLLEQLSVWQKAGAPPPPASSSSPQTGASVQKEESV
ncbi:MAG: hypothetical protein LBR26_13615 [Prevotella sp.]|jgi:hypothetical protein|nr:hypothetical protein [Prevotella sp.]